MPRSPTVKGACTKNLANMAPGPSGDRAGRAGHAARGTGDPGPLTGPSPVPGNGI